jgi:D-sedoheptulose 7-phosphate isomerase
MSAKFNKLDRENEFTKDYLKESLKIAEYQTTLSSEVFDVYEIIIDSLNHGGKILLCGNGGSASDAQHIAAELVNKFKIDREPIPALALTTDTSTLTSIANDYGYEFIFSKQIQALGTKNDVLIAISTSGNSKNILNALQTAKNIGLKTIIFTGENYKDSNLDKVINIPSKETGVVQQSHITLLQLICGLVENSLI